MVSLPSRALDWQLSTVRWLKSTIGQQFAQKAVHSLEDDVETSLNDVWLESMEGPVYAVSTEMSELIFHAARPLLDNDWPLDLTDIPSRDGFIYFETYQKDDWSEFGRNGTHADLAALSWNLCEDGDTREYTVLVTVWAYDTARPRSYLLPFFHFTIAIGEITEKWRENVDRANEKTRLIYAFIKAFFRFIAMPYVSTDSAVLERAAARRANRAGKVPEVLVITLRKKKSTSKPTDEPGFVDWSHRWVVHGFWRNQWYPSLGVYKPIWIMDFIKGPDDKPLIVKDQLFHVRR